VGQGALGHIGQAGARSSSRRPCGTEESHGRRKGQHQEWWHCPAALLMDRCWSSFDQATNANFHEECLLVEVMGGGGGSVELLYVWVPVELLLLACSEACSCMYPPHQLLARTVCGGAVLLALCTTRFIIVTSIDAACYITAAC
jgi:hypothetical protein